MRQHKNTQNTHYTSSTSTQVTKRKAENTQSTIGSRQEARIETENKYNA